MGFTCLERRDTQIEFKKRKRIWSSPKTHTPETKRKYVENKERKYAKQILTKIQVELNARQTESKQKPYKAFNISYG